jgi:dynein heavy chain
MPQEFKQFQQIDKTWTKMMRHAYETRNVLECCLGGDIPKNTILDSLSAGLELCQQSLGGYLNAKRNVFPRLYLIPDSVLLAMLSQYESLDSLVPQLKIVFSNVSNLRLREATGKTAHHVQDSSITKLRQRASKATSPLQDSEDTNDLEQQPVIIAIESAEGELLNLQSPVILSHNVEEWLLDLSRQISMTVGALIDQAVKEMQTLPMGDFCYRNCAQTCQLAVRYLWTRDCEKAICSSRYDRKAVMNLYEHYTTLFNRLPVLLMKGKWRTTEQGVLTKQQKLKVQSVLVCGLHLRDCLEELLKRKLRDLADFDWRKYCRLYIRRDKDSDVPPKFEMSLLDSTVPYGCEYQGLSHRLVPTPMTDHAFVALSQTAQRHRTAVLSGEPATGKTETVKALAQLFGKFMLLLNCTSLLLPSALSNLFRGVAQDGAWCCLDDLHTLSVESLSVAVQMLRLMYLGLQSTTNAVLFNGIRITVATSFAAFATASVSSGTPYVVPSHCRSVFRTVGLSTPDMTTILKAWLTNEGFRSPKMLADRIAVMASLCKDQL